MARGRITIVDWLMLALAIVSVAMLAYETWGNPTPDETRQILLADYVIIGIFAIEFSLRWARDDRPKTFVLRNWYELLGMIPVAHPAIRGFRLFRLLRIIVILSRFGRAADRAFGQEFTYRFLQRFKGMIVDTVSGAVTLRVLAETEEVLLKGDYTRNLADAMEARGDDVTAIIVDKVREDPTIGKLQRVPYFDAMVHTSSDITQRVLVETLRDPRMDALVKDIIKQNIEQIKTSVAEKEAGLFSALPRRRAAPKGP